MGLVIHPNQTTKQPVVWVCCNADCAPPGKHSFAFESDEPVCPKCKSDGYPTVQKRVLVHLLVRDPMGPIAGHGGRFSLACDPPREELATIANGEAASGEIEPVNCPGCLAVIKERKLKWQGMPVHLAKNL